MTKEPPQFELDSTEAAHVSGKEQNTDQPDITFVVDRDGSMTAILPTETPDREIVDLLAELNRTMGLNHVRIMRPVGSTSEPPFVDMPWIKWREQ